MDYPIYDVIIVGAGASGLMAACRLLKDGKSVLILEAMGKTGGRIRTIHDPRFLIPVEEGAEFIHGDFPLTKSILKKANIHYYEITGEFLQKKNGKLKSQEDLIEDYSFFKKK